MRSFRNTDPHGGDGAAAGGFGGRPLRSAGAGHATEGSTAAKPRATHPQGTRSSQLETRTFAQERSSGAIPSVDPDRQAAAFEREHLFPAFEATRVTAQIGARPRPAAYEPFDYVA